MAAPGSTCETHSSIIGQPKSQAADMDKLGPNPGDTPTRKNKRKLSEPRRRTDFSINRFCPESPGSSVSESGCSDDFDRGREHPPGTPNASFLEQDESSQSLSEPRDTPTSGLLYPYGDRGEFLDSEVYLNHAPHGTLLGLDNGLYRRTSFPHDHVQFGASPMHLNSLVHGGKASKKTRKNYKNMTRERRIEANARERSRVHTISAAFENLRRAVPSYSYNQKLSKLAILRIACCYILALARLADMDYSEDQTSMSFSDCVDMCTRTIQTEGRARRRH